jgi:hypothetical protein
LLRNGAAVIRSVELRRATCGSWPVAAACVDRAAQRLEDLRAALDTGGGRVARASPRPGSSISMPGAPAVCGRRAAALWARSSPAPSRQWRAVRAGGGAAGWPRRRFRSASAGHYARLPETDTEISARDALMPTMLTWWAAAPTERINDTPQRIPGLAIDGETPLDHPSAVLAQAGAPVCAARLRLSPLAVGTSMRIADSLQAGTSRFYAEIQRLRQLVDRAQGPRPLLFLLDEILHGTNSHDRRLGAEAVVRGLVARGAVGLITTHDLSLAAIVDGLAPRAANVHFEDHLENGRMTFDYRMRAGVVRKSNALELMRAVGLEVP